MIKEHDRLAKEIAEVMGKDLEKAKELSKQKDELLSRMSKEELNELLKRPYPPQYKMKIKKYM